MNNAFKRIRPNSNWISATLLTLFVVSFGLVAESHIRPEANEYSNADICTSKSDNNRLFVRYH